MVLYGPGRLPGSFSFMLSFNVQGKVPRLFDASVSTGFMSNTPSLFTDVTITVEVATQVLTARALTLLRLRLV